ncbi:MAG: DUF1292 domain-containing protein [Firmicutes bacterium]|nr:DUF1292 domain-containing protein [Bacillota bacterium]
MMEDAVELEVITLEDGIEYAVTKEINNYLLLVNPADQTDFCIRKKVFKDGNEYIESLDTDEEFNQAIALFQNYFSK